MRAIVWLAVQTVTDSFVSTPNLLAYPLTILDLYPQDNCLVRYTGSVSCGGNFVPLDSP